MRDTWAERTRRSCRSFVNEIWPAVSPSSTPEDAGGRVEFDRAWRKFTAGGRRFTCVYSPAQAGNGRFRPKEAWRRSGALAHKSCCREGQRPGIRSIFSRGAAADQTGGMKSRVHPTYKTEVSRRELGLLGSGPHPPRRRHRVAVPGGHRQLGACGPSWTLCSLKNPALRRSASPLDSKSLGELPRL